MVKGTQAVRLDRERWLRLAQALDLPAPRRTFARLSRRYGERRRRYHGRAHLAACLAQLDGCHHPAAQDPLVEYALWFHDAIYNPLRGRNEQRSADWAVSLLRRANVSEEDQQRVVAMIMATRHGEPPQSEEQQLLVDIDLTILGADTAEYARFERQVREEYWWVPYRLYRKKRIALLRHFLDRSTVYQTREFRIRLERQARSNLRHAVMALASGRVE